MKTDIIRPSKIYYGISVLIFVSGIILFVITLLTGIKSSENCLNTRIVIPSTEVIELKESGKYNIFYEYKSVINDKIFISSNINGLMCTIKNIETDELIKVDNTCINSSYSFGGRDGECILDFAIEKPGKYEINTWYENDNGDNAVLAIGKSYAMIILRTILISLGILFSSIALSLVIILVTYFRRKRAKFDLRKC